MRTVRNSVMVFCDVFNEPASKVIRPSLPVPMDVPISVAVSIPVASL
jgi:hypothetical protein